MHGAFGRPFLLQKAKNLEFSAAQGNGYAVMTIGWRGSEGRDVVRIAPGAAPADAPILGSLPAVMVAWLEGRQP